MEPFVIDHVCGWVDGKPFGHLHYSGSQEKILVYDNQLNKAITVADCVGADQPNLIPFHQ